MHPIWTAAAIATAATTGAAAGHTARAVLATLTAPVHPRPGVCEATTATAWALLTWQTTTGNLPPWWLPIPAALTWLTVVLTATDLRHRLLPNRVVGPAYPVLAALLAVAAATGPGTALALRAAIAGTTLFAVHAAIHLAAPRHLGAGDVKLAGLVGGVLGAVDWTAVLLGPVVAAVVTTAIAATSRRRTAPHGPGLLIAALLIAALPQAHG